MAPERILVAQMTRMGDVLQTSPLIHALKQRHPGAHITVMIRKMGKAIAECNPNVNDIIVYEEDDTFLDLRSEDADRLLKAYETTDSVIQDLKRRRFDIVYNCTHSLCSAMMFKLAEIPQVIGAHLSDDWRYVWRGRGPNYFLTSVLHRDANDLNLCDSFRYFMEKPPAAHGLTLHVDENARVAAQSLLAENGIGPDEFVACFQLGASDRDKRWPESRFAALAQLLKDRHNARVVLVGVQSESYLGDAFEKHLPGVAIHLFGKTTIPQLAALLEHAAVLVTNDTGTMHIAAAVNCPLVLVSVGYVHFRETGPYGKGFCAIEERRAEVGRSDIRGRDDASSQGILPDQVARALELVLEKPSTPPLLDETPLLAGVDLHWSDFAADGCLQWYPVIRRAPTNADIIRIAYRPMWIEYFEGAQNAHNESTSLKVLADRYLPEAEADAIDRALEALAGVAEMANQGQRMTRELLRLLDSPGLLKKAQSLVKEMMGLDENMRVYAELNRACKPIIAIARFERDNLEGADPAVLSRRTLEIYRDIEWRARKTIEKLAIVRALFTR